jgi:hypothetical protein
MSAPAFDKRLGERHVAAARAGQDADPVAFAEAIEWANSVLHYELPDSLSLLMPSQRAKVRARRFESTTAADGELPASLSLLTPSQRAMLRARRGENPEPSSDELPAAMSLLNADRALT